MTRKRFIKNCMSIGIHRNAANYLAKCKDGTTTLMVGRMAVKFQITNVQEAKDGCPYFRVKLRKAGGVNE